MGEVGQGGEGETEGREYREGRRERERKRRRENLPLPANRDTPKFLRKDED